MWLKIKPRKALMLMEVALVVLITAVIALFLFRGYRVFIDAHRKSTEYLQLAAASDKQLWELKAGNTANKDIETAACDFPGLKRVILRVYPQGNADRGGLYLDTVFFAPVEEQ